MAHAQKPDFVSRRNERVYLNRQGRQFSRLLAAEVRASEVVMLDTSCSVVVWRVLGAHSIRQFSLHFPSRASTCAITFQLDSKTQPFGKWHSDIFHPFGVENVTVGNSAIRLKTGGSGGIVPCTLYLGLTWVVSFKYRPLYPWKRKRLCLLDRRTVQAVWM